MASAFINVHRFLSVDVRRCTVRAANVRNCLLTISVGLWTITGFPAHAEHASQPGYDPRQIEKRFEDQQSSQGANGRPRLPSPQFGATEGQGDSKSLFVLRHVTISGAVAVPPDRLVTAYQPYVGKKVSQADLAAIASAVSDAYRAAGFHLSRAIVPPQDVQSGELRIQVIEGNITDLTLKGEGADQFGVRPMLAAVLAERPSRLATLERQLLLINGRPGVRIEDTAIEEIGTASGQFRLILSLKTWHVFTSFGVDNLGSSSVGPWQSYGTAAFNSYLAPGDSFVVNLSTTPGDPRQLAFGRLSYEVPVGTDGARIGASGYYSEVWPGDYRHLYSDNIKTESFEVRGSIAPLQSQRSSLTLTAAAGFTNASENDVFGPIYADRIRTASLTSDYRLQDNFGGTNYLTVNYRHGLDIFGASHRGDDDLSRVGASGTFSALNFWYARYQTLTDAWSLKLAAAGQTASGPLFTSQQFYLGGIAFGRGYGSAEISGDNGLAGTVELRFDQKTNLKYLSGYQLYAFVDSGVAWNDGYRLSEGLSLTSAGGGVRFFLAEGLQADIGAAAPLSYRSPDNPGRGARVLLSLTGALKLCPVRATTRCL
ncbi:ShlB/FhaC/HecB family hemolysin secretion/activation protein [Bradyrhizobium archetypum]|uniref:ShlB/FhaC/HecB family hemolysin secretion/activation protein n=1 Tax=Bradyrhizobium archetypum TaxID=2721160 RepID=A0A7Y4H1U2_9BRAD|nr:ShlB/FhaC/HecB family hemolysin secretion/activation protein [Bradyrhizobium archetypum]NOJ46086.1 ShlB/FhaC/HecB family hemolysin secretion/activation protein [Bradyrhizobium archetypum]